MIASIAQSNSVALSLARILVQLFLTLSMTEKPLSCKLSCYLNASGDKLASCQQDCLAQYLHDA